MTEIAIGLGIVGLVLGAIWVAASITYEGMRQNKFSAELLQMRTTLAQFGPAVSIANFLTDMQSLNAFPSDLGQNSPWQQGLTSVTVGTVTLNSFTMPTASCIQAYIRNCGPNTNLYCGLANLVTIQSAQPPIAIIASAAAAQCVAVGGNNSLFQILFSPTLQYHNL